MQVLSLWCSRSNLTWQGILKNLSGSNFIWVEVWSHNVSLQHARLLKKTTIPVGRTESYFSCCNDWVLLFDMFLLDMNGQQLFFEGFKGNIKNNWPSVLAHYEGLSPSEATSAPSRKMTICRLWKQLFTTHVYVFFVGWWPQVAVVTVTAAKEEVRGRRRPVKTFSLRIVTDIRLWTSYRSYTYFSLNHDVFLNQTKRVWLQQSCCFGSHLPSYLWKLWVFR